MRVGQKLILGFTGIALLAGGVGVVSVFQNKNTQKIAEREVYASISYLESATALMEAQEHQEIAAKDFLFLDVGLQEKRADYFYEKERIEKIYRKYLNKAHEYIKPLLGKYYENIKKYHVEIEGAFELHRQGAAPEVIKKKVKEAGKYAEIAHEDSLEPLIKHVHEEHIEPAKKEITKRINRAIAVTVTAAASAMFLAISLGLFISRSISRPITKLKKTVSEIGKGRLGVKSEVISKDEIGELAASFNEMSGSLKLTTVSRDYLDNIFNASGDAARIIDTNFNILMGNESMAKLLGVSRGEIKGNKCYEQLHGNLCRTESCTLKRILRGEKIVEVETLKGILEGKEIWAHLVATPLIENGKITGVIESIQNITKRKSAEENLKKAYIQLKDTQDQLVQAEKLNAVGQLASGVAHEVKNPLGVILQGVDYLIKKKEVFKEEKNIEVITMIKNSVKRADKIVHSLLDFSKATKVALQPEDIGTLLRDSLNLVKGEFRDIRVIEEIEKDMPKVMIDKNRMEQVFVNLFFNAIQAMPQGGDIVIRGCVKNLKKAKKSVGGREEDLFEAGEKAVVVEVEDTGVGIFEMNLKRVFDPFFTTRSSSGGSGLGLSVSRNIIVMHRGLIEIESQKDKGAKVTVTLKIAKS